MDDPEMQGIVLAGPATGRAAEPEEIAATVLFLCSGQSSFTTGAIYPVDGGQVAH